jgi:phosphopantothenoylcysteine decarboxylase/phosphopantothenate--cysteine ligase
MTMLKDKRVLLIVGGGIAAYKTLELVRRLKDEGVEVRSILTTAGARFVTPLSLASLTGAKVYDDLFSLTDEVEMGHIELSRWADLLVVAPATADLLAKMAAGIANDLASTALLATDKPVMAAPAMNVRMWEHPATQRNVETLKQDGVLFAGPVEGPMACGEFGMGRLTEVPEIVAAVRAHFAGAAGRPLAGKRVLVTAGPTHEPIDPVRYIANRSSGKQGYAIAEAFARAGADTTLVAGPVALSDPPGVTMVKVETAREMLAAAQAALPADIAVFTAAVADWRVANAGAQKLKKDGSATPPALALAQNPDILATVAALKTGRPRLVVGFAAETEDVIANARRKLDAKGCDLVVANDVSPASGVMGGERNRVHLVTAQGVEEWPDLDKQEVARRLVQRLADRLA